MTGALRVERPADGVARLTLNRPDRLNALDGGLVNELVSALDDLDSGWPDTKVIVLCGAGRAFCAGVDLTWVNSGVLQDPAAHNAFHDRLNLLMRRIETARHVVVAAAHGHAVAGGFELLLACDLVVASRSARLGDHHIRRDLLPAGGGSQRLPRKIGLSRSLHLLLTGHHMTGDEAVQSGLACACVDDADLDASVMRLARDLSGSDAHALSTMKALVHRGIELPLTEALQLELHEQYRYRTASSALDSAVAEFASPREHRA